MSKTVHSLDVPVICGTLSTRWDCDAGTVDNSGRAVRIYDARNGGGENKHSLRVIDRNGKHGRGGNARRFFGNREKQARTRLQGRYSTFLQRGKSHAGVPCRSLGQDLGRMPQCPRIVLWRPPEGRFLKVPVRARLPQSPGRALRPNSADLRRSRSLSPRSRMALVLPLSPILLGRPGEL